MLDELIYSILGVGSDDVDDGDDEVSSEYLVLFAVDSTLTLTLISSF